MCKLKDLTGMKFGRLTIIEYVGNSKWLCRCDCGNEKIIRGADLKRGRINSCGCYKKDKMKEMWKDEEFRQMQSEQRKRMNEEMWKDEEFRQMQSDKMREMVKEKWQNEGFRQMQSEKTKEQWQDKEMKWRMGYKGGITPISIYLRNLNEQWANNCKQQANYTCELTGKVGGNLHTHHLKAFSTIVLEAHELHNIQIHEIIGEYTKEELHKLEEYVTSWHKDNLNAVVLCDEIHSLFHSLYGKGNNTKEQFEEFKERYLNGEFNDLLGDDLNV